MIGGKDPAAIKVGTQDVKAVYAGTEKVWPAEAEITYDPNDLIRIKEVPYGGISKGNSGHKNMCADHPEIWLVFGSNWMITPDRGGIWIINGSRPDGWVDQTIRDCVWDGSRWCAVGSKGLVMFSSDGSKWSVNLELTNKFNDRYSNFSCVVPSGVNTFYVYGGQIREIGGFPIGPLSLEVTDENNWRDMPAAQVTPGTVNDTRTANIVATGSLIGPYNSPVMTGWYRGYHKAYLQQGFDTFLPCSGMPNSPSNTNTSALAMEYHQSGDFRGFIYADDGGSWPMYYQTTNGMDWVTVELPREHYNNIYDQLKVVTSDSVSNECILIGEKYTFSWEPPTGNTYHFYRWGMKDPIYTGVRETADDWCKGGTIVHAEAHGDKFIIQTTETTNIYEWRKA